MVKDLCAEKQRLKQDFERELHWKKWGPYVAERQWGTVREDYSEDGDAWSHFPHEIARKRTYRWGEDGIAGVSDDHGFQNIAFSFWNGKDPFLKERLFGLSNSEDTHGESIKEVHFHLDNVPTHSYMRYLYKYPQRAFPYEQIVAESRKRGVGDPEYTIADTGVFQGEEYWDIFIDIGKETDEPDELVFRVTAYNRGTNPRSLHIIPQMWFRNTWAWGRGSPDNKPSLEKVDDLTICSDHQNIGKRYLQFSPSPPGGSGDEEDVLPQLIFTENETNFEAISEGPNSGSYVKDAFHRYIVDGQTDAINPQQKGTKCAAWYSFDGSAVPPGECAVVRFRLSKKASEFIDEELLDDCLETRQNEAETFYMNVSPRTQSEDVSNIQRQTFAGILWSKQHYYFIWDHWIHGDPGGPIFRKNINQQWRHMHLDDVILVRDSWKYPFSSAWDSAFASIPIAMVDPYLAKEQLELRISERYMHPNGQLPGYERNWGDSSPPVQAWAAYRVFNIERQMHARQDIDFLELMFQKLLINFTWWVNRKDINGKNLFEGGFLGLDNLGVFNRSDPLPTGGVLEQADSTGWMAFYCLNMLNISVELAKNRRIYESMATKFFEHFILISDAMQNLWSEVDGFYYDAISWGAPWSRQLPIRSLVGLVPLYATLTLEPEIINRMPQFKRQLEWFIENRHDMAERNLASMARRGVGNRLLLSLVNETRLRRILSKMLDSKEFLSQHGVRSLSRYHQDNPYRMEFHGQQFQVAYSPAHAGNVNSNWRGPIWIPANFLLIESLLRFYMFYGDSFKVEFPVDSGNYMHLSQVADQISKSLIGLLTRDHDGRRPTNFRNDTLDFGEHWKDYIVFSEYFDADTGRGLGANHHTGWMGLIAKIAYDIGIWTYLPHTPRTPASILKYYFDEVFFKHKRKIKDTIQEREEEAEEYVPETLPDYVSEQLERIRLNNSTS